MKSPVSGLSTKSEPTLSDMMGVLKSQDFKHVTISTKLSSHKNKTDVIMRKLKELISDTTNLKKENCRLKSQMDTLRVRVNSLDIFAWLGLENYNS